MIVALHLQIGHRYRFTTATPRLRLKTFNALIDAVGKHEGLKAAERTFAKVIDEGLRPDRVTFTMTLGLKPKRGLCGTYCTIFFMNLSLNQN